MKTYFISGNGGTGLKLLKLSILSAAAMTVVTVWAQRRSKKQTPDGMRALPVVIVDSYGRPYRDAEVFASIRSAGGLTRFDRLEGEAPLRVADTDTVGLFVNELYFEFASAAFDTLFVTINLPDPVAGVADSVTRIDPVVVTARRPALIDLGMGRVSADIHTGSAYTVPLRRGYRDLKAALDGRVGGLEFRGDELLIRSGTAVVIVDGFMMENFADANNRVMMDDVATITIHRDAGMAAFYTGRVQGTVGGVLVITTKRGFTQKRR